MQNARDGLHEETIVAVAATPDALFARLNDPARLGAHMERRSPMMMGGKMAYEFDVGRGQAVGSVIRMSGRVLGMRLYVDEVVTEIDPPRRKVWKTIGTPRLCVIAGYTMGFAIATDGAGSRLRVFIDYAIPLTGFRPLIAMLARTYARWCVRRIANDARRADA
jgi:hypothetical protein